MTINKTTINSYAFTYNINYKKDEEMNESDYQPILDNLNKIGRVTHYVFEIGGKQNRLHLHGVVQMDRCYAYPSYLKQPRSVYKVEQIYNLHGWIQYLRKDQKLKHETENTLKFEEDPESDQDVELEAELHVVPTTKLF